MRPGNGDVYFKLPFLCFCPLPEEMCHTWEVGIANAVSYPLSCDRCSLSSGVLLNNFFRERYVTVTINWKMVINWHIHSISETRKCSFLALEWDKRLLVPGHFTAPLITRICSNGEYDYCNCLVSRLLTFSYSDSSIASRKLHQRRQVASCSLQRHTTPPLGQLH